jgi:aspartate/methionine/tyrosine aminotransferase
MKVVIDRSERLQKAPQALLGMMRLTERLLKPRGLEYIDLDSVIPEIPNYQPFLDEVTKANLNPAVPATASDIFALKEKIANLYADIYGRPVNPIKEIALTPGSRMAMLLLCVGMINPDDIVAHPDPGLPMYRLGAIMAGAKPQAYPLLERNEYLPNLESLTEKLPKNFKLLILNYPHNPTGAEADLYFYRDLVSHLRKFNTLIALDCPLVGQSEPPLELPLQLRKGADHFVELHSFGYPYGLDGLGFAIGHQGAVAVINQAADVCGFHPSLAQVKYAEIGIKYHTELATAFTKKIADRRQALGDGLKEIGWTIRTARHGPFIWAGIPSRATAVGFARKMFIRSGVRARAGSDFGEQGEGYLRLSLTTDITKLETALENIGKNASMYQRRRE